MWLWWRERSLTSVMLLMFVLSGGGLVVAGHAEFNATALTHGGHPATWIEYLVSGHLWAAIFENWESEFLQMAVFVLMTVFLYQKGSPESKRIDTLELVDVDPRRFRHEASAPWPVRRGGWVLRVYENSLGLCFAALFLASWAGHAVAGWREYAAEQASHGERLPSMADYLSGARFWFESFQNWQSEFLAIAAMVWCSVYLRQRGSPESKPVHASHDSTGRD